MCGVVWLSLLPSDSPVMKTVDEFHVSDKILHFCAYLVLSLLSVSVGKTRRQSAIAALLMGALGIVLEILQGFTPTRSMELMDAVASCTGVACGTVLGFVLFGNLDWWGPAEANPRYSLGEPESTARLRSRLPR